MRKVIFYDKTLWLFLGSWFPRLTWISEIPKWQMRSPSWHIGWTCVWVSLPIDDLPSYRTLLPFPNPASQPCNPDDVPPAINLLWNQRPPTLLGSNSNLLVFLWIMGASRWISEKKESLSLPKCQRFLKIAFPPLIHRNFYSSKKIPQSRETWRKLKLLISLPTWDNY